MDDDKQAKVGGLNVIPGRVQAIKFGNGEVVDVGKVDPSVRGNTMSEKISCETCPPQYKEPCVKEYGEFTGHGDDHTAIEGTHFCRFSWADFKCCRCKSLAAKKDAG